MARPGAKNAERRDQVRRFPHGSVNVIVVGEATIGRGTLEPGWRWTVDMAPVMGTPTCQQRHLGVGISGRMQFDMDDGTTLLVGPDDVYEVPPGHDAHVVGDEPFVGYEFLSAGAFARAPDDPDDRRLGSILFTDIVDSTRHLERLGDRRWHELLAEHNRLLRSEIDRSRGREVKTTGDGFLALFQAPARAVRCGRAMVASVTPLGIDIRVGVHTGEIELVGDDVRGLTVHTAARIMSLAGPGEVFVSGTTADLAAGSDLVFEDRGTFELKGLSGSRPVFSVT
jgi:class 3 adenylate cyclase